LAVADTGVAVEVIGRRFAKASSTAPPARKDKLKITIRGYSPSKKARETIIRELIKQLESNPDRLQADAKKSGKNPQSPHGIQTR
jgi:hypothetical protein